MKYLIFIFFLGFNLLAAKASARFDNSLVFERLARFELENNKFNNTKIGGLSGAFFLKGHLYALSDDRGKVTDPRYYVFTVKLASKNEKLDVEVAPKEVVFVKPNANKSLLYMDGEGFAPLGDDRFLVSSEGDNNSKPRKPPRLFEINSSGDFLKDWVLPSEVIPESLGKQNNGIQNNAGFEGLGLSADGLFVLTAHERALVQEVNDSDNFVHFYLYSLDNSKQPTANYFYDLANVGMGSGVSEIISWKESKYFVLERGIKLEVGTKLSSVTEISLIDLEKAEMRGQRKHLLKTRLDVDLGEENFEAMAWGPAWGKYSRTLWILNDNNFSKNEKNVFLVYGVSESGHDTSSAPEKSK